MEYKVQITNEAGNIRRYNVSLSSYSEDGHFFNRQEADKWFYHLSGKKDKKKLIS